ncbi:MAG: hypothetical protein ACXAEU_12535 [Candidatus Hodarchaeales archaeon]
MSNAQEFCPECGGKLILDEKTQLHTCDTCGEEYKPYKKWKTRKQKRKELYTILPFSSDLGWKPSKTEAILKASYDGREERERKERLRSPVRYKDSKKRSKKREDFNK